MMKKYLWISLFVIVVTSILLVYTMHYNSNGLLMEDVSQQELLRIYGTWKIVEFVGNTREEHLTTREYGYKATKDEIEYNNTKYLNTNIILEGDTIESVSPPSELGYYYEAAELFDIFRTPPTVVVKSKVIYTILKRKGHDYSVGFLLDDDNNAFININNYFYKVEKVD